MSQARPPTFGRPPSEYRLDYFAKFVADVEAALHRAEDLPSTQVFTLATLPPAIALPGRLILVRDGTTRYIAASIDDEWHAFAFNTILASPPPPP